MQFQYVHVSNIPQFKKCNVLRRIAANAIYLYFCLCHLSFDITKNMNEEFVIIGADNLMF